MSYFPQDPVPPKYLADREDQLRDIMGVISDAVNKGRAANVVIRGDRGTGKTSLLAKVIAETVEGCFIVYYSVSKEMNADEFVDTIVQKINFQYSASLSSHKRYLSKFFEKIEEFSVAEIAIKVRKKELTPDVGLLECLLKFKERKFKAMMILIDEADLLSPELLALLRNTVQEIRTFHEFPVGLILVGKEDITRKLTGRWSPLRRFFAGHRHILLPLDYEGVEQAITLVANDLGLTWDKEAVKFVFEKSGGHPFIVQLFGDRAISVTTTHTIDTNDVKKAEKDVLNDVWEWYQDYWVSVPSETEKRVLKGLASINRIASFADIAKVTKIRSVGTHLRRLVKKRCLFQEEENGKYYFPHWLVAECINLTFLDKVT